MMRMSQIDMENIVSDFKQVNSRLLLLDYDGTLVNFKPRPDLAVPGNRVIRILLNLTKQKGTRIILVTGRSKFNIENLFKEIPIDIIAEHGTSFKFNGVWQ